MSRSEFQGWQLPTAGAGVAAQAGPRLSQDLLCVRLIGWVCLPGACMPVPVKICKKGAFPRPEQLPIAKKNLIRLIRGKRTQVQELPYN